MRHTDLTKLNANIKTVTKELSDLEQQLENNELGCKQLCEITEKMNKHINCVNMLLQLKQALTPPKQILKVPTIVN